MKKTIIIILSIVIVTIAIITAVIIYNANNKAQINNDDAIKIADEEILDDCTDEYEEMQIEMLEANSTEEKISPNCFMALKITHKKCGHQTSEYLKVPDELVNKTKEELQERYPDWNIQSFSDTEIVLTKEEEGECGEHYLVQDKEGNAVIYQILEDGTKKEYEKTDISTEYLSDSDRKQLKEGIRINGKQELNQLIEDFE